MINRLSKFVLALSLMLSILAANAQSTSPIVFLVDDLHSSNSWKPVISQLARFGVEDTAVQASSFLHYAPGKKEQPNSATWYIAHSHLGLVIARGSNKVAVAAIEKILSGRTSTASQMKNTLTEAGDAFGDTELSALAVDAHGFLQLTSNIWATMSEGIEAQSPNGSKRPVWLLLTSQSGASNKNWQSMMYRTIGAVTIELISYPREGANTSTELAKLIATRTRRAENLDDDRGKQLAGR